MIVKNPYSQAQLKEILIHEIWGSVLESAYLANTHGDSGADIIRITFQLRFRRNLAPSLDWF